METIIKVNPSELNEILLDKIRKFIGSRDNIDVTISLKEFDRDYANSLDQSIDEAENTDQLVTFSMDDFMSYSPVAK
jgi:hypothetical protein